MDNDYVKFYNSKDVMKMLKIGNRACLELFHREDFPAVKIGRAFCVEKNAFKDYVSSRRILA